MTEQLEGQMSFADLDSSFGKMYQAHSARLEKECQKEQTSKESSRKSQGSQTQKLPMCLCLVGGGWSKSGCIYDEMGRWSIAWRVHDAQFWGATQELDGRMLVRGTPQRRKRIALVADFNGLCAPEILFVRKGLHRDYQSSQQKGQAIAGSADESIGESDQSG